MQLEVNGMSTEVDNECSISHLIDSLSFPEKGTALAVNGEIISNADWTSHTLQENDKIIIIRATQGG